MIGKFLGRLLGHDNASHAPAATAREDYKGFTLQATPIREGQTWRVAGTVAKNHNDATRTHSFVRADTYADRDDATAVSLRKGRQLVDERGDDLFD